MLQSASRYSIIKELIYEYILWRTKEIDNISTAWNEYSKVLAFACQILDVNPSDMHIALLHEFERVLGKLNQTLSNFNETDMLHEMLEHNIEEELKNL